MSYICGQMSTTMAATKLPIEQRLNKEITHFFQQPELISFRKKLPRKITYNDFLSDKMLIISAIRTGISYSLFNLIQNNTPFSESDWADFLDLSVKSLQRYKADQNHSFKSIHSEKIIEMAEVTQIGLDVFGNMEKLKLWLHTPNFALGNFKPIDLLKDSYGKEMVVSELTRINHGIFV